MTLKHGYGVAIGTFASFTREDPDNFGHWYHGKLHIDTPAGQYEAALDVDTPEGPGIAYRLVTDLTVASLGSVGGLADGYHSIPSTSSSGALDYVRSPILRDGWVVERVRVWLARLSPRVTRTELPWGPTAIDAFLSRIRQWFGWLWLRWRWRSFPWIASDGNNALDVLEPLVHNAARIYIFGEPYTSGLGVHNVHMNQGDPPGPHQPDDGTWQDGAVVTQAADGRLDVWQVKFALQSLNTDDHGLPI